MINCSTALQFLKTGPELEESVHEAIDETVKLIFEHYNFRQFISPSQVTSKTNHVFSFFKYFHNHNVTDRINFDEKWCHSLFDISLEESNCYSSLNSLIPLLPAHAKSTRLGLSNISQVLGCISAVLQKGKLITSTLFFNLTPERI